MGQTLSEPVTEKESAHCQNDEFAVSVTFDFRLVSFRHVDWKYRQTAIKSNEENTRGMKQYILTEMKRENVERN